MNELALFAGAGGGILGGILNDWRTVCAVEINDYCRRVLMQRQDDGILEPFPIWSDITEFDGRPWAGCVDIVTGGFPCQDISAAGKGAGITGERSGLWSEMARVIGEVRPRYILVENSPMLTLRGLGTVLGDLAALGFDAEWGCVSAAETGAPHKRERIWIVANALRDRCESDHGRQSLPDDHGHGAAPAARRHILESGTGDASAMADSASAGSFPGAYAGVHCGQESTRARHEQPEQFRGWPVEPDVGRVAHGVADRVDRLKALGNGQVPRVVATAWEVLG